MKVHLDYRLKLDTKPEYSKLYSWAIQEYDGEEALDPPLIPWIWNLYFSGVSGSYLDSTTLESNSLLNPRAGGKIRQDSRIRVELQPDQSYRTRYSMMGTKREIKSFRLEILQQDDDTVQEQCSAWGMVSYTAEDFDFSTRRVDDCIVFYMSVKAGSFARYVDAIKSASVDQIILSVGSVDGFYSDWSPTISSDSIKILTAGGDQVIEGSSESQIEIPRLGNVHKFSLSFNRTLNFRSTAQSDDTTRDDDLDFEPVNIPDEPDSVRLMKLAQSSKEEIVGRLETMIAVGRAIMLLLGAILFAIFGRWFFLGS